MTRAFDISSALLHDCSHMLTPIAMRLGINVLCSLQIRNDLYSTVCKDFLFPSRCKIAVVSWVLFAVTHLDIFIARSFFSIDRSAVSLCVPLPILKKCGINVGYLVLFYFPSGFKMVDVLQIRVSSQVTGLVLFNS